jgi:hypothetical protein
MLALGIRGTASPEKEKVAKHAKLNPSTTHN